MLDKLEEGMEVQLASSETPDRVIATVKVIAFRKRDVEGNAVKDVFIDIYGDVALLLSENISDVVQNEDGTFKIVLLSLPPYSYGRTCGNEGCGCGGG